ncbi:MAG TPA: isoprenylcysteine carboxylmethyltransferase family protein [Methanothrix sp.]|nr:isoprenylcysteine carboxylmethyltransferase family protein [Methanothrix sp.]HRW83677.1 isoprenylcysteine carboxylmethyltransferase family protein [Methanothrix sp.]
MFSNPTIVLALYLVGYASLHSLLADSRVKRRARRAFGLRKMRWYRLFFSIMAAATLSPLLYLLYLHPGEVLYSVPAPWRWAMIAGQLAASLAFGKAFLAMGPLRFLGFHPDDGEDEGGGDLIIEGVYCRTRNPLFLFALIFLWLSPVMTENLLVLYLIATVYFYLGSVHEERTLAEKFGAAYRDYQRRVPRIVPRLRCRYPETRVGGGGRDRGSGAETRPETDSDEARNL